MESWEWVNERPRNRDAPRRHTRDQLASEDQCTLGDELWMREMAKCELGVVLGAEKPWGRHNTQSKQTNSSVDWLAEEQMLHRIHCQLGEGLASE